MVAEDGNPPFVVSCGYILYPVSRIPYLTSQPKSPPPMSRHIVKSDKPFIAGMFMLSGFYVVMIVLMVLANLAYLAKPVKDPAPVTDISGVVLLGTVENGHRTITVTNTDTKESRQYQIKAKYKPLYESGESVGKGKKLIDREVTGIPAMRMTLASPEIQYSIKLSLISCTVSTILSLIVAIPIGYIMSRFDFIGKNAIDGILDIPVVLPPLVIGISLLFLFNYPPFSWSSSFVARASFLYSNYLSHSDECHRESVALLFHQTCF